MVELINFPRVAGCQKTGGADGRWVRQDFPDPERSLGAKK